MFIMPLTCPVLSCIYKNTNAHSLHRPKMQMYTCFINFAKLSAGVTAPGTQEMRDVIGQMRLDLDALLVHIHICS